MNETDLKQLTDAEGKAAVWKMLAIILFFLLVLIAFVSYFPTTHVILPAND